MAIIEVKNLTKSVAQLVKTLNQRNRDIVSRRFGLKNGSKETLESIGKSYGITRERVRQIEEFALGQLAKAAPEARDLQKAVAAAKDLLTKEGGVVRERTLFKMVSGSEKDSIANASLAFALTLDTDLIRVSENEHFAAFWALDRNHRAAFVELSQALASLLQRHGAVVARQELLKLAQDARLTSADGAAFTDRHIDAVLAVSKDLGQNIFNEFGLSHWSQIRPKGVRDKAYLVIKKAAAPQHFSAIAKLINQAKFDQKRTNVQTVHNELIKDKRFVLVGRGMYALSEWGYKSGTVKDVLTDILKGQNKPLPRADLVARVMKVRMVKENTILLNLQDASTFVRTADGHYHLKK